MLVLVEKCPGRCFVQGASEESRLGGWSGLCSVGWTSRFLSELPPDTLAEAVPSLGSKPYTLATGWVWALAEPDPEFCPS